MKKKSATSAATPKLTQAEIAHAMAVREEDKRWNKRREELRAKWKGVTADGMWDHLWHTMEDLADMMSICRERYWEKQRQGEGEPTALELFDQTARALEGQLEAIGTLARHLWDQELHPQTYVVAAAKSAKSKTGGKAVKVPMFVMADRKTGAYKLNPILAAQEADKGEESNG